MTYRIVPLMLVVACASTPKPVRLSTDRPSLTLVWVGRGEAERYEDGA